MKRKFSKCAKYLIPVVSFIVVFAPFLIFAEDCPANQICNPLKYDSFPAFLDALLTGLIWLAIYIAPIILVIAGFYFATAMGDPKKIDLAKKMVLYTLIGFAVVYASKILVSVIANAVKDSIKVP